MQSQLAILAPMLGVFGAVVGAVVGAWLTRRLRDPSPTILVDHLEIATTSLRATNAVTVTNRELIIALEDDPFIGSPSEISSATIPEGQYVNYLRNVLGKIDEVIEHKLPTARALAAQLRDCLATDDYESFERIWAQDQSNLWQLLSIGVLRGDFSYSEQAPAAPTSSTFREVTRYSGSLVVILPGAGRDISFFFKETSPQYDEVKNEEVRNCAERTANAIAQHNRNDLVEAIRFLLNGAQYEAPLRELRERVKKELEAHNRLLLRGQISNTGADLATVASHISVPPVETIRAPATRAL